MSPAEYQYTDIGNLVRCGMTSHDAVAKVKELYDSNTWSGMTRGVDLYLTTFFILINLLYYAIFECFIKASLGKYFLGGIIICRNEVQLKKKYTWFKRAIVSGSLMVAAVYIHFLLNISLLFTALLFFLVIDVTVLTSKVSLIDILSNTRYITRKSLLSLQSQAYTETEKQQNSFGTTLRMIAFKNRIKGISRCWLLLLVLISLVLFIFGVETLYKENSTRLSLLNYSKDYTYYPEEKIYANKHYHNLLNNRIVAEDTLKEKIGPIPDGRFVSSFSGKSHNHYLRTEWYDDLAPVFDFHYRQQYEYKNGEYIPKMRKVQRSREVPVEFSFTYTISVYDISDDIGFMDNEDKIYKQKLDKFYSLLSAYENKRCDMVYIGFNEFKTPHDLVTYRTNSLSRIPTRRSLFFANKKAYFIEVNSNYFLIDCTNKVLDSFTTENMSPIPIRNKIFSLFLGSLVLCLLGLIVCLIQYSNFPTKNRVAQKLNVFIFICCVVNLIITFFLIKAQYSDDSKFGRFYVYSFGLTLIMNICAWMYLFKKSKSTYHPYFLIPNAVMRYYYMRFHSRVGMKSITAFIYYPLFTIGQLPMGILLLLYVLLISIIISIFLESRELYKWIFADKQRGSTETALHGDSSL